MKQDSDSSVVRESKKEGDSPQSEAAAATHIQAVMNPPRDPRAKARCNIFSRLFFL